MFVRSLREANFEMFISCMKVIIPWMFALDHVHYARWLPVYLRDLENLKHSAPSLYKHFVDGHFTVKKTSHNFSNIATDQTHVQTNKLVKINGGAVGILDSPRVLLKWSIAGPEITSMLEALSDDIDFMDLLTENETENESHLHHEDTKAFEDRFRKDVSLLYISIKTVDTDVVAIAVGIFFSCI